MQFLAPRQLPGLDQIFSDLGEPTARDVGALLGSSRRSFYLWRQTGYAPRPVMLALFWETSFGRSILDCAAVNEARTARGLVDALDRENAMLRARVAYLEGAADFGSANAPTLRAAGAAGISSRARPGSADRLPTPAV